MEDVERELTAQERKDNQTFAEDSIIDIAALTDQYKKSIKSMLKELSVLGEGDVSTEDKDDDLVNFDDLVNTARDLLEVNIKKQFEV